MNLFSMSISMFAISALSIASCTPKKSQQDTAVKTIVANEGNSLTGTYALFHIEPANGSSKHFCVYSAEISKLNSPVNFSNPMKAPSPDMLMKWALKSKRLKLDTPRSFTLIGLRSTFVWSSEKFAQFFKEKQIRADAEIAAYNESLERLNADIAEWDAAVDDAKQNGNIRIGDTSYRPAGGGITVSEFNTVMGQRNRAVAKYNRENERSDAAVAAAGKIGEEATKHAEEMISKFNVIEAQTENPSLEDTRTLSFIRNIKASLNAATQAGKADGVPCEGPEALIPKFSK